VVEYRLIVRRQKCIPMNLVSNSISFIAIYAEVTENECMITIHLAIHCDDRVQRIEMPFAPYDRAMLDARCLCTS